MMKIGGFNRLSNTPVRMLRYYDEINLLKPIIIDSNTGYGYYNANQVGIINQISKYKKHDSISNWRNHTFPAYKRNS